MRVAVVHDWLTGMRGGERVLEALLELLPDADIFTLIHRPGSVSPEIEARRIRTSYLDRIPGARRRYRLLLPFFPGAIRRLDISGYDLVVSTSHCVAHGAGAAGVPHLCYCHAPMRYVWDRFRDYFGPGRAPLTIRAAMAALAPALRRWDAAAARRVTAYVASSSDVKERIRRCWGRDAAIVHPPVDVDRFAPAARREDFYLVVSALVPYKRIDLAVRAFNALDRRLVIVGAGPELHRLRRTAGSSITFTGWLPGAGVADHMARCRAFIMPAHEDFGITAVEAQAAGAAVIAYGAGGALDTVIPAGAAAAGVATGVFFRDQTSRDLADAVRRFETLAFDPGALREHARRFDRSVFLNRMRDILQPFGA